jgi:hypothetical protein
MSDFDYSDDAIFVLDGIYNAIPPLPESVAIPAGKLFASGRAGISSERFDPTQNLPQVFLGMPSKSF